MGCSYNAVRDFAFFKFLSEKYSVALFDTEHVNKLLLNGAVDYEYCK